MEDANMNSRQEELLKLLNARGEVKVDELSELLKASPATIRRDLSELEGAGLLARSFGGATCSKSASLVERTFHAKREIAREEKERVAIAAAELVKPGMVVALDSGTTVWRLAAALKNKAPLTVLTCAMAVVEELGSVDGVGISMPGGRFRRDNLDFIGADAIQAFEKLHADIAFLGGDSFILDRGVYANDVASAEIGRAIAKCATKVVVVMDHGKFENRGCYQMLLCSQIDYVVTDDGLDDDIHKRLKKEKFKLIIAS